MSTMISTGILLAVLSGMMNGSFTLPMRFLGRWEWENVWSLFIVVACLLLPAALVSLIAPQSWGILAHAPAHALTIAALTGFAWGFGAILFGQSVSAIGISLANTLVLAISSALGSLLPLLLLAPRTPMAREGHRILLGVAVEIIGFVLCGYAGRMREQAADSGSVRGAMVGHARPLGFALLMALGSGVLSAVFNIGFSLAQPIADFGRAAGLSSFASTNLIWCVMLASGAVSNLGFCFYLVLKNKSSKKFVQPGSIKLYVFSLVMGLLWGGSIFVYGVSASRLGSLGTSIGWPLSLAVGLLLANSIGMGLGEWKMATRRARTWMYSGIAVLLAAVGILSWASA